MNTPRLFLGLALIAVSSIPLSGSPAACGKLARPMAAALPPDWFETVILHRPLLPNTVTRLSANGSFLGAATDLAGAAETVFTRDIHRYRRLVFDEHIIIRPNREPEPLTLGGKQLFVSEIVIGIHRDHSGVPYRLMGLLVIDGDGVIHEFGKIPKRDKDSFQRMLDRWFKNRVEAVKEARRRSGKG